MSLLTEHQPDLAEPVPPRRTPWVLGGLALALVALVGGLLLGRGLAADPSIRDSASIGFLRDMSEHHAQAVRMSEVVHRRATDPDVRYLAFDVMTTQQGQIGIMTGWLDLSGVSATSTGTRMGWMGTPHEGLMPGMATEAEIASLEALPVAQMETTYLSLLRSHHVGGVEMAAAGADLAEAPLVRSLAASMSRGQQSEIDLMDRLLTERGAEVPAEQPAEHGEGHAGHGG